MCVELQSGAYICRRVINSRLYGYYSQHNYEHITFPVYNISKRGQTMYWV